MKQHKLPPGYAVVQIDGEWYPIKIEKLYPEEFIALEHIYDDDIIQQARFSRRQDAIDACLRHECEEAQHEHVRWFWLAVRSDVYPDRCAHYIDEIETLTGMKPHISYDYGGTPYSISAVVHVYGSRCPHCQAWLDGCYSYGLTIDEALAQAVQEVYASRCRCQRIVEEHMQAAA
ncbi:hypothetical protein KSD_48010 [Ktedonobacter sp. SOSP1-85]|uniref:hypothetical protein n=1 Tax=Ktedonobacter sp. SOSP1-85 TaxID=2778367 RepID=UPI0019160C5B|nr:hypothetical protein [Ktedonobacter sp. SOSP1-85]GHO77030.1 hypothetical protein KSD_48010 [Ktedonobacter sp. SOSP1-85]